MDDAIAFPPWRGENLVLTCGGPGRGECLKQWA